MNRVWMRRWPVVLTMMAVLLLIMSGCGGGTRASSWTGLTVVGDTLYAADLQQARAINAENGETLWTYPKNPGENNQGTFYASPTAGGGHVFVTSQIQTGGFLSRRENTVRALDAETGQELWRFEEASGQYVEGGALSDDVFVIGNGDGNIYALDAENGMLQWSFETGHRVWATPLIVENTIYIGSMDRNLYALNLRDGQVEWKFHRKGAFAARPALKDGTLYIGAFDDTFYAIDAQTGAERWHFKGEDWFWGSPAVYDDTIYATTVGGDVYAFDAASGDEIWRQQLLDDQGQAIPIRAGPTLSEDGDQLFVNTENGALYALDTADGFEMWSDTSEGRALAPPIVSGSIVYKSLIYDTQRIRALHADNGREVWVYPHVEEE